jgi:hypothetical protein
VNIRVHIERLVLDGITLAAGEVDPLRAALAGELEHLLTERGPAAWLHSGGAVPAVAVPSVSLTPGTGGTGIGRAIARSVADGLGGVGGSSVRSEVFQAAGAAGIRR